MKSKKPRKGFINQLYKISPIIVAISVFIVSLILVRLMLMIPFIRDFVLWYLSFTYEVEYRVVFMELCGAIIGSFIAIYGALWTQRKSYEAEKMNEQKKHVYVIYYDLYFAFNDIMKIMQDAQLSCLLKEKASEEDIMKFCETAVGKNLYLNKNWIVDIPQMHTLLTKEEIKLIYKCYGKFINADEAMRSNKAENIRTIYDRHISWLIAQWMDESKSEVQPLMEKLKLML